MASQKIKFFGLKEDPDLWERLIEEENTASQTDAAAKSRVESMYWETDRAHAFQRYLESLDFRQINDLLHVFRISRKHPLCEIGGGSGQLAWSLAKSGFQQVELLEPNPRWITGTAWLETQLPGLESKLQVCNDLDRWVCRGKSLPHCGDEELCSSFPQYPHDGGSHPSESQKRGHLGDDP